MIIVQVYGFRIIQRTWFEIRTVIFLTNYRNLIDLLLQIVMENDEDIPFQSVSALEPWKTI